MKLPQRTPPSCQRLLVSLGLICVAAAHAQADVAAFSTGAPGTALAASWRATILPKVPRETRYRLVDDAGTTVLRADAAGSMSGLSHALRIDPAGRPHLEWRWKVSGMLMKSAFGTRAGDDFPARVYVLFDYDIAKLPFAARMKLKLGRAMYGEAVPAAGLCYVWDAKAPVGTTGWSPYTDRLRVIVVTSGASQAGQWVSVQRDVVADFRAAFGENPPPISGVALATDTDNTGESVTAWYGDVRFINGP